MKDISFLPTLYKMLTSQNSQITEKISKFTAHRTEQTNISKSKLIPPQEKKKKKKSKKENTKTANHAGPSPLGCSRAHTTNHY